jgi:hypothetical protein
LKLAVCAWLKADGLPSEEEAAYFEPVCNGFPCPSLEAMNNHRRWIEACGLAVRHVLDNTTHVEKTWTTYAKIV